MLRPLISLLLLWLACTGVTSGHKWKRSTTQCPVRKFEYTTPSMEGGGALSSLLDTTKATRESIVSNELPYEDIRQEINAVYNRSTLSLEPFLSLWAQYSGNYLYLSSFVLFVGVVFPLVVLGLWIFWECCRETDRDQSEDEEESRCTTRRSHVITWSLAVTIFLLLLLLCVFLSVLLAGNTLVSSGVREGGVAVGVVLPELAKMRDDAFSQVENVLVTQYNRFLSKLENDLFKSVGSRVSSAVRNVTGEEGSTLHTHVVEEVQRANQIYNKSEAILISTSNLTLQMLLQTLNTSLNNLLVSCFTVRDSEALVNSSVGMACENVTMLSGGGLYPRIHGNMAVVQSLVDKLEELLSMELLTNSYDTYLNTTLNNYITDSAYDTTSSYIGHSSLFGEAVEDFLQSSVSHYNTTLTFGLPDSQTKLEELLGPRYLGNWENIRSACIFTFAVLVLCLGVCLLVPIGRGLLSGIISGGDELGSQETAHLAGTALKKVSFVLLGVCVVSAGGFGFFLTVNGVLGRSCGRHNNFSLALTNIVDDTSSWNDGYPLGYWLVSNSSYPLTVGGVLDKCRRNLSLYEALELSARLDLNIISFSGQEQSSYRDAMRAIASTLPVYTPLTPSQASLFTLLHNTSNEWVNLSFVSPESIFGSEFIGFNQLQEIITSLESAVSEMGFVADSVTNETLSAILLSTAHDQTELVSFVTNFVLPAINESAVGVNIGVAQSRAEGVAEEGVIFASTLSVTSITETRRELSVLSQNVTQQLVSFASSSQTTLRCSTGSCYSLTSLYNQFTSGFCTQLVPGLDVLWSSLLAIVTLSLFILPLSLLLAGRFITPGLDDTLSKKFHLLGSIFRQIRSFLWLFLSLSVALWFIVSVAMDEFFLSMFCDGAGSECCVECVWVMGVVFLLLTALVGGASRIYQCVIIYRISRCSHAKVKRFWVDRKKAFQFYTQLAHLLLQDVPFLILGGVYSTPPNPPTLPALATIVVSLCGIIVYIFYLLLERGNILTYCTWLNKMFSLNNCRRKATLDIRGAEAPSNGHANGGIPMTNRQRPRGRYGSSESEQSDDSQGTTQQDGDWQYATTRLSNIPEQPEGVEVVRRAPNLSPSPPHGYPPPSSPPGRPPPPLQGAGLDDNGSYSELSQPQTSRSVMLDHLDPSNEMAMALRREAAIQQPMVGGVEIAPRVFATPTNSDFGSNYTMSDYPGYFSSQLPDDDYRDDYSDYSQLHSQHGGRHTLRLAGAVGGAMGGEVSMDV